MAPAMFWYMNTPGIIGTAPANATAANGDQHAIGRHAGDEPDGHAREQRGNSHAQVVQAEIAKPVADHAADDRHPEDAPGRVVERTEPAGGDAGQRRIERQRQPDGL